MTSTVRTEGISWPLTLALGLVNLAIGIVAIAWPEETLTVVVIIFGIQLIIAGVFRIVGTFTGRRSDYAVLGFIGGILGVVVGLLIMQEPLRSIEIIVTILGLFWVFWGLVGLISSFGDDFEADRAFMVIDAILSIGVGVLLLVWPAPTLQVLMLIIGIFLIVGGLAGIGLSIAMWQQKRQGPPPAVAY